MGKEGSACLEMERNLAWLKGRQRSQVSQADGDNCICFVLSVYYGLRIKQRAKQIPMSS